LVYFHFFFSSTSGYAKRKKKQELQLQIAINKMTKLDTFFTHRQHAASEMSSLPLDEIEVGPSDVTEPAATAVTQGSVEPCQSFASSTSSISVGLSSSLLLTSNTATISSLHLSVSDLSAVSSADVATLGSTTSGIDCPPVSGDMEHMVGIDIESQSETQSVQTGSGDQDIYNTMLARTNPTDRGYFQADIKENNIKQFIVDHGTCQPKGPFPKDDTQCNRCFSESYYSTVTKAGMTVPVTWLAYSPKIDSVYCEPCWLFADRSDPFYQPSWTNGIRKWQQLSSKIKVHSMSKIHINSCMVYEQWKKDSTISQLNDEYTKKEQNFWREVLKRLVKITLMLAKNCQSFRGHVENIGETYNGNFLSNVKLLAEFDPVLHDLLQRPQGTIRYLSSTIQNELIATLATALERRLVTDINNAPFYSVITDTTQDVAKIDQLIQTIRYIKVTHDDNGRPTDIQIKESFIGFYKCKSQTAADMSEQIVEILQAKGISLEQAMQRTRVRRC
jgi:hypothetical protein